ncbi:uncharacterized protein L969DRAFT_92712 [Mixia osmundae IAM 14324]|uniref:Enoyl-CoA hydratase n=1 Tax=Mixia osmundae (strain CBS 9802 / IAM 14324 / JCM 22182 / KY 12970) TaxID=764103 RepID=G7DYC0_MIXOS|nr:uncharacterized protein L969DRAFT_92712 [Mixia osmundae IAM 14324]KEI41483.1 hypothetical protein L969DRAFT_92712 [Mixia osmundae IAM 14324]GAA95580.1 hypothetical protein E5Q_02236 [Mixia osmundae IAM 14324]
MAKVHAQLKTGELLATFASEHIVLATLNRPRAMNAMHDALEADLTALFDWTEQEASVWCVVLTGAGKAFCVGQDLKDWLKRSHDGAPRPFKPHGFGSLSRRRLSKPLILAINGACLGGGCEILVNSDLVVASRKAIFGFPEVSRGAVAAQGGIPRLSQLCGHMLASELLLTGKIITAQQAHDRFHLVNILAEPGQVVDKALELASQIVSASPSAVQVTKQSLESSRIGCGGVEKATIRGTSSEESKALYVGANLKEGLASFAQRRPPRWSNPEWQKSSKL